MLPFDTLLAFFGIAVLLALTPGPDNLFVLMPSAMWGRTAGMFVVLGLCTGLLGHTAAVAAGLAAVFAASPHAFTALKLARSEERRVGQERVSSCRSRWAAYP